MLGYVHCQGKLWWEARSGTHFKFPRVATAPCLFLCACSSRLVDTARMNEDTLCCISQWWWTENRRTEALLEPWHWEEKDEGPREDEELFQRLTLAEPFRRIVLKERNSWLYTHRLLRII